MLQRSAMLFRLSVGLAVCIATANVASSQPELAKYQPNNDCRIQSGVSFQLASSTDRKLEAYATYCSADAEPKDAKNPADPETPKPAVQPLRIIPLGKWEASDSDVKKVLYSAAGELWKYFPDRELPPIIIQPKGGPIVLFRRSNDGELQVRLNTGKTYWAQYSYQFAHEFCHILCKFDQDPQRNKWFEESICEMASVFAMREMAKTWAVKPPYPNWKGYAESLKKYADDVLRKGTVPDDMTFIEWFESNRDYFYNHATDRAKNQIVARLLLPFFQSQPEHWAAVAFLNSETLTKEYDFKQYLAAWHTHCPAAHKVFVREIAAEFGIRIDPEK